MLNLLEYKLMKNLYWAVMLDGEAVVGRLEGRAD